MFTIIALLVSGYVIYCTDFDPAFGALPLLTVALLLVIGIGADAAWHRSRRSARDKDGQALS
jgi:hypothetical protein